MASAPQFIATVRTPTVAIANASGTGFQTLVTGGTQGSRIDSISASSTDASNAYVLQFAVQKSGIDYPIGEVSVPIGAGTNGAAKSVACLNPTDLPFLAYTESGGIYLESSCSLRVRSKTTVSGSNTVAIVGVAGDY